MAIPMVWLYNGYTNGLTIEWLHYWFDYIMAIPMVWLHNGYTNGLTI